ncbi:MAG TPA: helix-turn-helix domain-containing protein [Steroidobacteraceae bacterium]|jgi:AcrR family transcriptional regulator|nr:helix-turn-helix domain-containing protein [Steroidobacteraceae bacterium]
MTVKGKDRRKPYRSDLRDAAADVTRARIVKAARRLLTGGTDLPAFSLDAVAREAGVTRLTVYNRFESKRGLVEAVFDDIAERGGLFELRSVLADTDAMSSLRGIVAVFCRFWASHDRALAKLAGMTKLDRDIAVSLKQRTERRRGVLTVSVKRLPGVREADDLVDILFALTSFETFEALSVRQRSAAAVEALIWRLVEDSVRSHLR